MEKRLIDYDDLTKSEKIGHIWEYYKFHIIVTISVVALIFMALNHYIFNPPAEVTLDVSIFGYYEDTEVADELETSLYEIIVKEGENEDTFVDFFNIADDADYNTQQATVTKMIGKASMHTYDIMIFIGDYYQNFLQDGALLPLDDMVNSGIINIDSKYLIKGTDIDYTKDNYYLIDISDHEGFQRILNTDEKVYLAVFALTEHQEHINEAIDYILNDFK